MWGKENISRPEIFWGNPVCGKYMLSLVDKGFRTGLIDSRCMDRIQAQVMMLLKELILKFTKGESTSVTVETAERLLCSIYYAIDAGIYGMKSGGTANLPETASFSQNCEGDISLLTKTGVNEMYKRGLEYLSLCLTETRKLYDEIVRHKMDVGLDAYNMTIEGISSFFKSYNIMFNANDSMADIDYPLVFDDMDASGVFYIKQYLKKLNIETMYCKLYCTRDIERVLRNYGRMYSIDYTKTLSNIFEILLNNSIFSVISGNSAKNLDISKNQIQRVYCRLSYLNSEDISSIVDRAIDGIIMEHDILDVQLIEYIRRYKDTFITRLQSAMENNSLSSMVVTAGEEPAEHTCIKFEDGPGMDDDKFRSIISDMIACSNTADKIKIISSKIHSLGDFVDMLDADCLFEDEYDAAFDTLGDIELSVLGRMVFEEELRNGMVDISLAYSVIKKELEKEWQIKFVDYLLSMEHNRKNSVKLYINTIV